MTNTELNARLFHNNIPYGTTITKLKDDSNTGIILIMGQIFDDDPLSDFSSIFTTNNTGAGQFKDSFNGQQLKANMMYVSVHGINMPLAELGAKIASFSENYDNIHVISVIHGFEILPFYRTHEIEYYPNGSVIGYLTGSFISTKSYLQTLADGINKPFSLWLSSCQGEKMIETAQGILPNGSTLITESKGYVLNSHFWVHHLQNTLYGDDDFSINSLLNAYLALPSYIKSHCPLEWFNLHPVKTIIGQDSIVLDQEADLFSKDLKDNKIKESTIIKIIEKICTNNSNQHLCTKTAHQTIDLLYSLQNSVNDCYTHVGEESYFFNKEPDNWCHASLSSSCELSDASNYLMALALGNTYQDIENVCNL